MILSRNYASTLLLGIVPFGILMATVSTSARAGGYSDTGGIVEAADRCAAYGQGYIDMGHGTCGRVHVRVESGTRAANANPWSTGATSSAALRSDGLGMVPGAGVSTHLRVRNGLESYSPFQ